MSGAALPPAAGAAEVQHLQVSRDGARYQVQLDVRLQAPGPAAFAILSDLSTLPRLNPAVQSVTARPGAPAGAARFETLIRYCFAFFCKDVRQTQDLYVEPDASGGRMRAEVLPRRGDLRYGVAHWRLQPCPGAGAGSGAGAGQSCMHFDATLELDFWVPPLIGPWVIQRKLRDEAVQTSTSVERLVSEAQRP